MKRWIHAADTTTHTYYLKGEVVYNDNKNLDIINLNEDERTLTAGSERQAASRFKYRAANKYCKNHTNMPTRVAMSYITITIDQVNNIDHLVHNTLTKADYDELRKQEKDEEEWQEHMRSSGQYDIPDESE